MSLKDLDPSERAKIASLLSKDKKQDDIGWMYSQTKDDPEVYLLGKEVKSMDQVEAISKDYEESPSQRLARIDMEAKFREDPLTLMKQREAEKRMELLKNTAKVKKLRRLLTEQKLRKDKKKKEKRFKERHHKHKHRSRSSSDRSRSSSSSSSSGDELLDKFIKIVRQSDDQKTQDKEEHTGPPPSSPKKTDQKPQPPESKHMNKPSTSYKKSSHQERPRLSKEELEARRAQMMADAKEHEKERSSRASKHYHEKKAEEEKERIAKKHHGPSFISSMKVKHVDQISIEEGIHRKANSRQKGELSSNFLSR